MNDEEVQYLFESISKLLFELQQGIVPEVSEIDKIEDEFSSFQDHYHGMLDETDQLCEIHELVMRQRNLH